VAVLSDYKYRSPVENGYIKFKLTKKQHNEIFKRRKMRWTDKYEYYYNDNSIILEKLVNWKGVLLYTIFFPIVVLLAGLMNIKEAWRELIILYKQKEKGSFVSDNASSKSEIYQKVMKIIK
jgi:hypothetical protein